eukprot:2357866-Alexandrium_andersonii.AAC.1
MAASRCLCPPLHLRLRPATGRSPVVAAASAGSSTGISGTPAAGVCGAAVSPAGASMLRAQSPRPLIVVPAQ